MPKFSVWENWWKNAKGVVCEVETRENAKMNGSGNIVGMRIII